jgi:hypothetical protein
MLNTKDAVKKFKTWPVGAVYLVTSINLDQIDIISFGSVKLDDAEPTSCKYLCNQEEFESVAKDMGYINGYKFDKKYTIDRLRENLSKFPEDLVIKCKVKDSTQVWRGMLKDCRVCDLDMFTTFKIIDTRFKPKLLDSTKGVDEDTNNIVNDQRFTILSRVTIKNRSGCFVVLSIKKNKVKVISDDDNKISKVDRTDIMYIVQSDLRDK